MGNFLLKTISAFLSDKSTPEQKKHLQHLGRNSHDTLCEFLIHGSVFGIVVRIVESLTAKLVLEFIKDCEVGENIPSVFVVWLLVIFFWRLGYRCFYALLQIMSGPLPAAPVLWPCMPALFMPAVEFMFAWFSFVVLWMDVGSREMFAGNWLLFAIRGKLFLCLRRSKVCVNQEIECSLWQTTFGNAHGRSQRN